MKFSIWDLRFWIYECLSIRERHFSIPAGLNISHVPSDVRRSAIRKCIKHQSAARSIDGDNGVRDDRICRQAIDGDPLPPGEGRVRGQDSQNLRIRHGETSNVQPRTFNVQVPSLNVGCSTLGVECSKRYHQWRNPVDPSPQPSPRRRGRQARRRFVGSYARPSLNDRSSGFSEGIQHQSAFRSISHSDEARDHRTFRRAADGYPLLWGEGRVRGPGGLPLNVHFTCVNHAR